VRRTSVDTSHAVKQSVLIYALLAHIL